MCRSIKRLNLIDQLISEEEILKSAKQYVRKISGIREPSKKNKIYFEKAIEEIAKSTTDLLKNLKTLSRTSI